MSASGDLSALLDQYQKRIKQQLQSRCYEGATAIRKVAIEDVLTGARHGNVYKRSGTYGKRPDEVTKSLLSQYKHKLCGGQLYQASAPGEPPAARSGHFRESWQARAQNNGTVYISRIESDLTVNGYNLGALLEGGTSKMAPRPYKEKILTKAAPKVHEIYARPYF